MWKIAVLVLTCILLQEVCSEREKRNVAQFARMIRRMTGRPALKYNKYGCWCGLGGGGKTLDGVDRCCRTHDRCYGKMRRQGCKPLVDYYHYRIRGGRITCNPRGRDNACERGICACDRAAAICFGRHPYYKSLKKINKTRRCF